MDHSVPMDRLPDGLKFPPEFDGRIRHDAARRALAFRGFMSKAEFDKLSRLHDDWGYRRSLEDLFRLCTPDPDPRPHNRLTSAFARLLAGRERSGA